jgi:hypothetical protein
MAREEHRSTAVAREFQREHPCPATGDTHGACPGYVKDHIVPLACGGPDEPENMQWQSTAEAKAKDRWERFGCTNLRGDRYTTPPAQDSERTFWDRVAAERLLEEARRRESRR